MVQMIEANWLAFALALVIGLLVAWWILRRSARGERVRHHRPDVLDEGAAPARRNQALIDADPAVMASAAASMAATGPDIMMGMGEIAASAAAEEAMAVQQAAHAAPAATTESEADDLRKIKGVGPKLVVLLNGLGVTRFQQIADWTDADIARIDPQLGTFQGRIARDNLIDQAAYLARGDKAGFEAKYGALGGEL